MEKTVGGDFYGMGMVFPFTKMQWQELQRQALIYKHFMASVPVPPDLLLPSAAKSFPETPAVFLPYTCGGGGGGVADGGVNNVRFGNDADLEPGRCRRTDGKKWRCARDAEPDQKYCERHLNRGRPRSRKPVEQPKTRQRTSTGAIGAGAGIELNLPFQSMESNEEPRCEEWMKSYSENSASKKQWEMINSMIGLKHNTDPVMQHYEDSHNLSYTDASEGWRDFFNSDTSPFEGTNVSNYNEPPRTFIDAWSSENCKLPLSTLTLSMSGAEEETANQIPACLSLNYNNIKSQPLNWMKPDSPLGGPLAEVLQSSNVTSHESSPRDSPSRFTSSPSGVLQKALVSLSDSSSSSSSPTFAAASRADFALQWTNLNK